mmetsp:Transcript_24993/g.62778  ORF Transcript_24993/g.62778 Transcript_24993/m.62778 type:complete len:646 (+) Transcript_24993:111-2048(+)
MMRMLTARPRAFFLVGIASLCFFFLVCALFFLMTYSPSRSSSSDPSSVLPHASTASFASFPSAILPRSESDDTVSNTKSLRSTFTVSDLSAWSSLSGVAGVCAVLLACCWFLAVAMRAFSLVELTSALRHRATVRLSRLPARLPPRIIFHRLSRQRWSLLHRPTPTPPLSLPVSFLPSSALESNCSFLDLCHPSLPSSSSLRTSCSRPSSSEASLFLSLPSSSSSSFDSVPTLLLHLRVGDSPLNLYTLWGASVSALDSYLHLCPGSSLSSPSSVLSSVHPHEAALVALADHSLHSSSFSTPLCIPANFSGQVSLPLPESLSSDLTQLQSLLKKWESSDPAYPLVLVFHTLASAASTTTPTLDVPSNHTTGHLSPSLSTNSSPSSSHSSSKPSSSAAVASDASRLPDPSPTVQHSSTQPPTLVAVFHAPTSFSCPSLPSSVDPDHGISSSSLSSRESQASLSVRLVTPLPSVKQQQQLDTVTPSTLSPVHRVRATKNEEPELMAMDEVEIDDASLSSSTLNCSSSALFELCLLKQYALSADLVCHELQDMFLLQDDHELIEDNDSAAVEASSSFVESSQHTCVVCLSMPRNTTLLPCRHFCVCSDCLPKLEKCPVCRSRFVSFLQLKPTETEALLRSDSDAAETV